MKKRFLQIIGSATLTTLLLYAVFSDQSFHSFFQTITDVDLTLLFTYICLSLFGVFCRAERYRVVLRDTALRLTAPPRYQMLVVTLIRNGLVDLLPARLGEASFLYVCKRYGFSLLSALSAFGVCLVLDVLVLFGLLLTFFLFQFAFSLDSGSFTITPTAAVILTTIVLLLATILYQLDKLILFGASLIQKLIEARLSTRVKNGLEHLHNWATTLSKELNEIKKRGSYPRLVLLTTGLRAAKYLSLYILLLAVVAQFGVRAADISPLLSTTAFIGAEASASLPISGLMGFGAYEAAWSAIFSISSLDIPSIPAVILAVHVITQVLGYSLAIIGLFIFLIDEFRSRRQESASNIIGAVARVNQSD